MVLVFNSFGVEPDKNEYNQPSVGSTHGTLPADNLKHT